MRLAPKKPPKKDFFVFKHKSNKFKKFLLSKIRKQSFSSALLTKTKHFEIQIKHKIFKFNN